MSLICRLTEQLNMVHAYLRRREKNVYADTVKCANETIKELSAKLQNSQWIPCNERLPEEYDEYMVAWKPKSGYDKETCLIGILEYEDGKWIGDISQYTRVGDYDVFAWMPLPEQYNEVTND